MKTVLFASLIFVSSVGFSKTLTDPKVSGGLSGEEVQVVVRDNLRDVRHCNENTLKDSPKAKGTVSIEFSIDPHGKVASTKIAKDTVGDKAMGECILKTVAQWSFPKSKDGKSAEVSYPFQFSPS